VIFRSSPARPFTIFGLLVIPLTLVLWSLLGWLADKPVDYAAALRSGTASLLGVAIGGGLVTWRLRRRPTWVRVSPAVLEVSYRGAALTFAWTDLVGARVRRRWLQPVLEIIPTDLYATRVELPSRDLPPIRQTTLGPAFVLFLSDFRPGARALRAALPSPAA